MRRIGSVACLVAIGKKTERVLMESFCAGCRALGLRAEVLRTDSSDFDALRLARYDAVAMAGARTHAMHAIYTQRVRDGLPVFYVDNGYLMSRWSAAPGEAYYRVTAGAMQCDGRGAADERRLERLGVSIEPWREPQPWKSVLLVLQSDWWYEMHGTSAQSFCAEAIDYIRDRLPYRHVIVRTKPMTRHALRAAEAIRWDELHAVVTHSSALAWEAILAGLPGVTLAQTACWAVLDPAQYDVGAASAIAASERRRFAAVLAANQWTVEEIAAGVAVRTIVEDRQGWVLATG